MSHSSELNSELIADLEDWQKKLEEKLQKRIDWASANSLKKESFRWFQKQLREIKPYDTEKTTIEFRQYIYEKCIDKGEVKEIRDENGKIVDITIRYTFIFGLEAVAHGNNRNTKAAKKIQETINNLF